MNKTLHERLLALRIENRFSQGFMGDLLAVSQQVYSNIEKGINKKYSTEFAEKANKLLTNNLDEGQLKVVSTKYGDDFTIKFVELLPERPPKKVPIIGDAAAGAGMQINVDDNQQVEYIDVGDMLRDSEAAFTVYGNSMNPNYPSGCILGIKHNLDSFIQPGEIYLLVTRSNRVFKRLYYNKNKTGYYCHSDNTMVHEKGDLKDTPYYPPFEVPIKDVVSIHDVVGMIKRTRNSGVIMRQT